MDSKRISVAVPSVYYEALLETWAAATGRPLASLGAHLLEKGLETALKEGIVPAKIVSYVNSIHFDESILEDL